MGSDRYTAITANQIKNDTLTEAELLTTNEPTDGYVAVYDDGSTGFTWVAPGSLGYWSRDAGNGYTYLKTSTDKVGIGTSTPSYKLQIDSNVVQALKLRTEAQICRADIRTYSIANNYSNLRLSRIHTDSDDSVDVTVDTDILGRISFEGYDGSGIEEGATIQAVQDGAVGTYVPTNLYLESYSSTGINSNQLVLHNDGTIGIGTDSPSAKLHVETSSDLQTVRIYGSSNTTQSILRVLDGNNLTTGSLAWFSSNSADTSERYLVRIINDNASATQTHCLFIQQDSNYPGITVDVNGNAEALYILADTTTDQVVNINANSLTTGTALYVYSNSSDTNTRDIVYIRNDNPLATGATVLHIRQDSINTGITIEHNDNGVALYIDTPSATTNHTFQIYNPSTTTGDVIRVADVNSLTSGNALHIRQTADVATTGSLIRVASSNPDTSARNLVYIINDDALATGTVALRIQQDSTSPGQIITQNANGIGLQIVSYATTQENLRVTNSSLTTGELAYFQSDSSDTNTRDLIYIRNDNVLATGARCLRIQQDSSSYGALISSSHASGWAVAITGGIETGKFFSISESTLTTGYQAYFYSNSADSSTRNLVYIRNDNASATGATCLYIDQDSSGTALSIDSESVDGYGLVLDVTGGMTTGWGMYVFGSSLTTGKLARFYSNSSSASTRSLVDIVNDNASATGATCLYVRNDSTDDTLMIDQDGNGVAFYIDSEATTATSVITVSADQMTTGTVLRIPDADALTTGKIAYFYSNSADTSSRQLVSIINDNASSVDATPLYIVNDATATTGTSGAGAMIICTANTTGLYINASVTDKYALRVQDGNALTTGSLGWFYSNSADASARNLVEIINANSSATSAVCLFLDQDANSYALNIDSEATTVHSVNISGANTSGRVLRVTGDSLTTGSIIYAYSNSTDTSTRHLVEIINDNVLATGAICLYLKNDGGTKAIQIVDGNEGDGKVLTSDANGVGTWQDAPTPGASSITPSMLNTATSSCNTSSGAWVNFTLSGGEYSFYPTVYGAGGNTQSDAMIINSVSNTSSSSAVRIALKYGGGNGVSALNRYITASGRDPWAWVIWDKTNKKIVSTWYGSDHPSYGSGTDETEIPHPFIDYIDNPVPEDYEIILIDYDDIKEIENQYNKHAGQITTAIVSEYTVDEETEDTYGSETNPKRDIADQAGNHRDVQSIPSYIKIRKLKLK